MARLPIITLVSAYQSLGKSSCSLTVEMLEERWCDVGRMALSRACDARRAAVCISVIDVV